VCARQTGAMELCFPLSQSTYERGESYGEETHDP
jgi:hypothetical protein